MAFAPDEFLAVGDEVLSPSQSVERHARTALGRAYYACFLGARDRLARLSVVHVTGHGEDHTRVENALRRTGIGKAIALADELREMRENRADADYDLSPNISEELTCDFAREELVRARRWMREFRTLSDSTLRQRRRR